jgi:hypothetical protein
MQPNSATNVQQPPDQKMTKSTPKRTHPNSVLDGTHTPREDNSGGETVSENVNQYKRTKGALEHCTGAMHRMSEHATIADVLHELFENGDERELFPQILAGISEELCLLGEALQSTEALDPEMVGTLLIRLSRRLDLALAFEQKRAEDPGNYVEDSGEEERASGEFPVAGGLKRQSIVRPVPKRRVAGES